ncbi:MAG TPA: hypothetical protein VGB54_13380 [Allosphingosinicella sp.]
MMETMQTTLILAAFGFAAFAAGLMATLKMWQGWLELKRAEITRKAPAPGEERVEIAELRARVKQLEAIAACVDL